MIFVIENTNNIVVFTKLIQIERKTYKLYKKSIFKLKKRIKTTICMMTIIIEQIKDVQNGVLKT